ncbi:Defense-related protein containing SCP domain [Handroanthus impetiginosus]|uniref:Defense-related protein containing SCP domain n=1 Tax=Handroanthus impetiginosus TaxID=429701 RepID=A0A2G9HF81_9LAMI|nr:Defense-related protein containing SCP domain [Handroanthus impetiginosus]
MSLHKISHSFLSLLILLSSVIIRTSAQNSAQDYVNAHNTAHNTPRGQLRMGSVVWDTTLANYAQNYANQRTGDCILTHSNGPYGENLAKGSSSTFTGVSAVNIWVPEEKYYSYSSNSCIRGNQCLHYTQVVWHDSPRVGCARVRCNNGWYYVVCSYDAPGNWVGEWPY